MPFDAESLTPCRGDPALSGGTAGSPLCAPHGGAPRERVDPKPGALSAVVSIPRAAGARSGSGGFDPGADAPQAAGGDDR